MFELNDLFGGALCCHLPRNAVDISKLRQVPDNQEVFAHANSDQSIIIDILEYVTQVPDSDAIEFHFKELTGTTNDSRILSVKKLETKIENCDSVYYLNGQQAVAKYKESAKNLVDLHLALFRLKNYDTDILITFNNPLVIDPQSSSFQSTNQTETDWTHDNFKQLIDTFRIVDYNLFSG